MAKFVPNILTADILKRMNIPAEKFNADLAAMIRAGVERLDALQRPDGGWGWFDHDAVDPFMTACAVHGLAETLRLGHAVDRVRLRRGTDALRKLAADEKDPNRLAYLCYALAVAAPDQPTPDVERLRASAANLSPYALALLTLTLHGAKREAEAGETLNVLLSRAIIDEENAHWTTDWYYKWENVDIETTAYALLAVAVLRPDHKILPKAAAWLLARRNGNRWKSTKDTAAAIGALLKYVEVRGSGLAEVAAAVKPTERKEGAREKILRKIGVRLNGSPAKELLIDLNDPTSNDWECHFGPEAMRAGENTVAFDGASEFVFGVESALRTLVPDGKNPSPTRGLTVATVYNRPIDNLHPGDEVEVAVTVTSDEPRDYVMILSPIPAGCEIVRGSGNGPFARFEERYEKALFFVRGIGDNDNKEVKFTCRLRCLFAGTYAVLPPSASLMYDEDLRAVGLPRVAVIRP